MSSNKIKARQAQKSNSNLIKMTWMARLLILAAGLALAAFALLWMGLLPAADQLGRRPLTIEDIFDDELSRPSPTQERWTPNGHLSFFLSTDIGRDLWLLDISSGEKRVLVSSVELKRMAPSPTQVTTDERERTRRTRFGVPDYHWSPEGDSILFTSSGKIIIYDLATKEETHLATSKTGVLDPMFSPDGKWIAFVYNHDIWVASTAEGDEKQITFGGHELLLHGDLDWVYPEELDVRAGYHWSPDSCHIAFLEMDESVVPTYPITEEVSNQATVDLQRYPKAGDPNPKVRVGIVQIKTGRTAWIDRAAEYIPRIQWVGPDKVAIQLLDRAQEKLELVYVEPKTGRSTSVLVETDDHWINVTNDLTYINDETEFLWTSERTGFRHIYLYRQDGKLIREVTNGDWQVSAINGVDEEDDWVYFIGNCDNPIGQDLYRVNLDGTSLEKISEEKGTHRIDMNPDATAYLDDYSSLTEPGRTTFREIATGKTLAFHEPLQYEQFNLVVPEYKRLNTPDGAKISILLLKPKKLERNSKYPVLVNIYGMLGSPVIRDAWGGNRYLFHNFLLQNGYIVAQLDDRTGAIWGHKYAVLGDHDIGPVALKDHEVAVNYLKNLSYVDGERMGIWGWSGGGFTTSFHMTHSDLFKVGIAGAPVTDWHLYDSILQKARSFTIVPVSRSA